MGSHITIVITFYCNDKCNYITFYCIDNKDKGLIQSVTCTEGQQKEDISCVVTDGLSFSFIAHSMLLSK